MKRIISMLGVLCLLFSVFSASAYASSSYSEAIDMSNWQYNEADDVYWQAGIQYCSNPADITYETLGIYVPGAYFDAVANGDGTYTINNPTNINLKNLFIIRFTLHIS